ncbi:2OG-Fe(II) oxygenase [Radicibacter daui]|uniref:2OG-Fe(II) oxygenase n=1 Tax=Radicibacter daui TaxID=3064829 RepID=UPI004046A73E
MTAAMHAFEDLPPCHRIAGLMGPAMVERLLELALTQERMFVPTKVGSGTAGVVNPVIRSSLLLRDFGGLRQELEACFTAVLDEAIRLLRLSPFRLDRLELELVAHNEGAFYSEHIDTFTAQPDAHRSDRVLTGVYYFHRQPKAFSGGDLRLHAIAPAADGERRFIDIPPDLDTLVLFPSWVPHEVRQVSCPSGSFADSRFALSCWYRSRRGA